LPRKFSEQWNSGTVDAECEKQRQGAGYCVQPAQTAQLFGMYGEHDTNIKFKNISGGFKNGKTEI
jgi:hypothetical protein